MPFVDIANTAKVTCRGRTVEGEVWANVYHVKWSALGAYDATMRALWTQAFTDFYTSLEAHYCSPWTLDQIDIRSIETEGSPTFSTPVTTVVGTAAGDPLPPQVSLCVSWAVGAEETRKKGRTYLPAPAASKTSPSGGIDSTFRDEVGAICVTLLGDLDDAGAESEGLAIASMLAGGSAELVTALYIDQWFDTQRRRRDELVSSYNKYGGS